MSIKKFVAAAVAVLGMAGMASAQSPGQVSPVAINEVSGTAKTTGAMEVSYEVTLSAEMTVTPKTVNNLFVDASSTSLPGNMGSILVKTNYPHWDITVSAANRLRLKQSDGVVPEPPFGGGAGTPSTGPTLLTTGSNKKIASTEITGVDTALLTLYIGIVENNAFKNVPVCLTDSLVKGGAFTFSKAITDIWPATNEYNGQKASETVSATSDGGIREVGFNTPPADGTLFYVNAGLGENAKVTRSKNGIYKETLTFTLLAGF